MIWARIACSLLDPSIGETYLANSDPVIAKEDLGGIFLIRKPGTSARSIPTAVAEWRHRTRKRRNFRALVFMVNTLRMKVFAS